jgi:hypothetical protein
MNPQAAGWQPDPSGRHDYRYWDGAAWTDDVSDNGQTSVDPLGSMPGGSMPGSGLGGGDAPTSAFDATQPYGSTPTPGGYGTPSSDYGIPAPGYGTPPPGGPAGSTAPTAFGPSTGYGTPAGGYGTEPPGFGTPPPGFGGAPGTPSGQYPGVPYGQPAKKGPPVGLLIAIAAVVLIGGLAAAVALLGGDDETSSPPTTEAPVTTPTTAAPPTTTAQPPTTAAPEGPEDTNVFTLQVGDCLVDPSSEGEVSEIPVVPCSEPHTGEIFLSHTMTETALPSDAEMEGIIDETCVTQFATFVGIPYEDSVLEVSWLSPTAESWDAGDRELLCIVNGPSNQVVGTLEGSNR